MSDELREALEQVHAEKNLGPDIPPRPTVIIGEAADVIAAAARRIVDADEWPFCPLCGNRNRAVGDYDPEATYCSPSNCESWKVTAMFDHATREWITGAPKSRLDGTIWWCEFHEAGYATGTDCWGAGLDGQDLCSPIEAHLVSK